MRREWLTAACLGLLVAGCAAEGVDPDQLGKSAKVRILVDKVMCQGMPGEQVVRAAAEAGFNVFSPRSGGENEKLVRENAEWAAKCGILYCPWMRGTLGARTGLKYVTADGKQPNIHSPNADELWDWMTRTILLYARVSRDQPALMGVFLDYEIYAEPWVGWAYNLSYDGKILGEFARVRGITIPEMPADQCAKWLKDRALHEAFEVFQIDSWRQRCRELRRQVDAINPKFRFVIYPGPNSPFLLQAAGPAWSTPRAPAIFADVETYGRPAWWGGSPTLNQPQALAANRERIDKDRALLNAAGFPYLYVGGVDPVVRGADPEFSARNAVMAADVADGYWVFYEGPSYDKPDHDEYWRWFVRANDAIEAGDHEFWKQPRETQDLFDGSRIAPKTDRVQVGAYGLGAELLSALEATGRYEVHLIRDVSPDYLQPLDVVILQDFSYEPWQVMPRFAGWRLRDYIRQGGRAILVHDTAVLIGDVFPEAAKVVRVKIGANRYGRLRGGPFSLTDPAAIGSTIQPFSEFARGSRSYWTFRAGDGGRVVAADGADRAVCVVGQAGEGRVVFVGPHLTGQDPTELAVLTALIDHLAAKK